MHTGEEADSFLPCVGQESSLLIDGVKPDVVGSLSRHNAERSGRIDGKIPRRRSGGLLLRGCESAVFAEGYERTSG